MPKDYGYFGKGSSGYAHYQQTFNSCFGSGSGGGGGHRPPNNNNGGGGDNGCLEVIGILVVVIAVVLIVLQVSTDNPNIALGIRKLNNP